MYQILLVEDEFIIAKDVKIVLQKKNNVTVFWARNFAEAEQTFNDNNIDIIVCDVNLNEEKDGIDLITMFQKIKNVPVVYLTAYDSPDILMRAKQTMPFAYLLKPFKETQLNVTIELAILNFKKKEESIAENSANSEKIEELTKREKEVLVVLASGKTSKEMGAYLNISSHTVEKHKKNIKKKLELNTVGELINFTLTSNLYEIS